MTKYFFKVEKTSKRGGKIISSDQIEQQLEDDFQREQQEKKSVTDLLKNPTKVVCLRVGNIVFYSLSIQCTISRKDLLLNSNVLITLQPTNPKLDKIGVSCQVKMTV